MDRSGTQLDATDRAIIEQLQADGRIPYTRLGAAVGLSEAAVRQRVQRTDRRRRDAGRRRDQPAVARAAAHGDDRRAHRRADRRPRQDACRRWTTSTTWSSPPARSTSCARSSSKTTATLLDLTNRIRSVPGVVSTETFIYLDLVKQTFTWGAH